MSNVNRFRCDRCGLMTEDDDCTWLSLAVRRSELDAFRVPENQADFCSDCERSLVQWMGGGPLERLTGKKP